MRTITIYGDELYHHGIKGQKWGIRRYQNPDGTLTEEGRKHLGYGERVAIRKAAKKEYRDVRDKAYAKYEKRINDIEAGYKKGQNLSDEDSKKELEAEKEYNKTVAEAKANYKKVLKETRGMTDKQKKALIIGAAAVGVGLAAYATYKISQKNASNLSNEYEKLCQDGKERFDAFFKSDGNNLSLGDSPMADFKPTSYRWKNGSTEKIIPNVNARKQRDIQEKISKNIYNRITGEYDPYVTDSIPTRARFNFDYLDKNMNPTPKDYGYQGDYWRTLNTVDYEKPSFANIKRTRTYRRTKK